MCLKNADTIWDQHFIWGTNLQGTDLSEGWRDIREYSKCKPVGNQRYETNKTALIKVLSVVLPEAFNFVLNTLHPDY